MKHKLSQEDVLKLADMVKIRLTSEEAFNYADSINEVLDYISILQEVDISGVEAMITPVALNNTPLRDDIVEDSLNRDELLAGSACAVDGAFCVPRTIDG